MPAYTATSWVDNTTPASAGNMNHIEGGVAGAYPKDGSDPMTAAATVTQTLAAADKVYADFTATDGKRYQIIERNSDKALVFKNLTDGALLLELGPAAGTITANGQKVWTAANDGAGSGLDADTLDGISSANFAQKGAHSAGTPIVSYGTGTPATLAANEVFFQLS